METQQDIQQDTLQQNTLQGHEELNFDADISSLMDLIIHAFYSKNEIFLRELLSNSSDALEKIRYESLTDKSLMDVEPELKVKVWVDKEAKTLSIEDTGIGMTRHDLVHNLGTIARSGTKAFLENIKKGDLDQIGQFGVGFYSSYLVADKVTVYTKHNSESEYIWESKANKTYTIKINENPSIKRGTRIILHLKEDNDEYLDIDVVKDIVKKYTQFISFPIELQESREVEEVVEEVVEDIVEENVEKTNEDIVEENVEKTNEDTNEVKIEEVDEEDNDQTDNKKTIKKTITEWNVINEQKPVWCRKPDDISEEEYQSFYKNISNDYSNALVYKHFHAEGQLEFDCLLYVPERRPFDMFEQGDKKKINIKLYVKRIFIMDDCDDLIPEWLKFMKGVVDSNDIPLNVSRELLQQNRVLKQISKVVVKKSIELFTELSEDKVKYKTFYDNFSKMIKLGVHEDSKNRDKLSKLLRFYSSEHPDEYISFDEYVSNMKEDQKNIYFITGQNNKAFSSSPFIEKLKVKGYEVLYFTDPIDEYMVQSMQDYDNKKLVDVTKEGLKFEDDSEIKKKNEDNDELLKFFKETLKDYVQDVKISNRLKKTPCVLVTAENSWSANMERIIQAQALRNSEMDQFMGSKKIFEVNIDHKIIKTLKIKMSNDDNKIQCADIILLLYDTAQINSGFVLEKPSDYANKVNRMVELGFCDDNDDDEAYNDASCNNEACNDEACNNEACNDEACNDESQKELELESSMEQVD